MKALALLKLRLDAFFGSCVQLEHEFTGSEVTEKFRARQWDSMDLAVFF